MGGVDDTHCVGGGGAPAFSPMVLLDVDEQTAFKAHVNNLSSNVELGNAGIPLSSSKRQRENEKGKKWRKSQYEIGKWRRLVNRHIK